VSAVSLAPHIDQKNGERGGMGGDFLQQADDAAEDEEREKERWEVKSRADGDRPPFECRPTQRLLRRMVSCPSRHRVITCHSLARDNGVQTYGT